AKLTQPLAEPIQPYASQDVARIPGREPWHEHADAWHLPRWLGLGAERRCEDTQHQENEERGSFHRITSSAKIRSDGGIVIPRACAVFRLITSSNFVGCSTGRSAGVAPLRSLSTKTAARRHPQLGSNSFGPYAMSPPASAKRLCQPIIGNRCCAASSTSCGRCSPKSGEASITTPSAWAVCAVANVLANSSGLPTSITCRCTPKTGAACSRVLR